MKKKLLIHIVLFCSILRGIALVVILMRAGLGLDPQALKRLSGMVFRLAFTPCLVETVVVAVASHLLLGTVLYTFAEAIYFSDQNSMKNFMLFIIIPSHNTSPNKPKCDNSFILYCLLKFPEAIHLFFPTELLKNSDDTCFFLN